MVFWREWYVKRIVFLNVFFVFKIAKKEEIARRLEGDLSSLQETIKSYAEEVKREYHGFL